MTIPTLDATPDVTSDGEMVVYVIGNDIQEIINDFDNKLKALYSVNRQGDYVKLDHILDLLLDTRNQLRDLICLDPT